MAMVQPRSTKYRVLASHLGMLGFIVIILFPLLMVISISFRSGNFAAGSLLPENPSLEHWYLALGIPYTGEDGTVTQPPFPVLLWLWNSIKIAVISSVMILALSTTSAYAFARMEFRGRDLLFTLLLCTMMIPPAVLLIPNFLVIRELGLVDSVSGVLLPGLAGAFGIFLLRQAFLNIPTELEHAARIDGCGSWGILLNVILPLSKPALITLGLFTFMSAWNMFEWPLVVLSNQDYYPLTVGLSLFRSETSADWPRIFAASVMGAAPLIFLFLLAQRYLVGGISLSGMKT